MFKEGDKVRFKEEDEVGVIYDVREHRFTREEVCIVHYKDHMEKALAKDLELVKEINDSTITVEEFDQAVTETNPFILFKDKADDESLNVIAMACSILVAEIRAKLFGVEND